MPDDTKRITDYETLSKRVALIKQLKLPGCDNNGEALEWVYFVLDLVAYLQWPDGKWKVESVTKDPTAKNSIRQLIAANVTFECNGAPFTCEIETHVRSRDEMEVKYSFDGQIVAMKPKQVSTSAVKSTPSNATARFNVIQDLADEIHKHVVKAAWKHSDSTANG